MMSEKTIEKIKLMIEAIKVLNQPDDARERKSIRELLDIEMRCL